MPERPEAARFLRRTARKPQSRRRSLFGRFALLAVVPLALYSLSAMAEKSLHTYRLRQETTSARREIEAEKQENLRLQQELIDARGDQQIEDAARRYLNLVKPGDNAVVLAGAAPPSPTPRPAIQADPPEELPGWAQWLLTRLGQ